MSLLSRLELLAQDAQYDLACACGTANSQDHRKKGKEGHWLYPVSVVGGGTGIMMKTLMTNMCTNDCGYCPLRSESNTPRTHIKPQEVAQFYMDIYRKKRLIGIFLSSGVLDTPDRSMQELIDTAFLLRKKYHYRGYIHTKIIPGASDAAIEQAIQLSSAVSLNIETPGSSYFEKLSRSKNYDNDIIRPIKLMSSLTQKGAQYSKVNTTTQFIVGASDEKDKDIISYMWGLYDRLHFGRIYFSGYQKGLGNPAIPGEQYKKDAPEALFMREHRLYQSDFLMRKYGFRQNDFIFSTDGTLDLSRDPKQVWADNHPEFFPVSFKKGDKEELLRVPGLGPILVQRILEHRKSTPVSNLDTVKIPSHLREKARPYLSLQ